MQNILFHYITQAAQVNSDSDIYSNITCKIVRENNTLQLYLLYDSTMY